MRRSAADPDAEDGATGELLVLRDTARAMSQENVEIVRRAWEVFMEEIDEGNPAAVWDEGVAAVFDQGLFAPTHTVTPPREVLGSKTYVGREGFSEWMRIWTEDFLDWKIWPEKIIDADGDRVAVVARQSARGKESGVAVELQVAVVYTLNDGQIIEEQHYLDPAEALEAVGLSEQDAHADS
jgi:ketosteroid isomerase-like protein